MIRATVDPGVCRFATTIEVTKINRRKVTVEITSECQNLDKFRESLREISGFEPMTPRAESEIHGAAAECKLHPACPVPVALMKAVEIEMGLALSRNVSITFERPGSN